MALETLTVATPPTGADADDSTTYGLGTEFTVAAPTPCPGVRWTPPATITPGPSGGTYYASLWQSGGSRLAHKAITPLAGGAPQDFLFDTPVNLTSGNTYVAQIHTRKYAYRGSMGYPITSPSGNATGNRARVKATSDPDIEADGNSTTLNFYVLPLLGEEDEAPPVEITSGDLTLPALVLAGTLETTYNRLSAALSLPPLTLSGTLAVRRGALTGTLSLPALVLSGSIEVDNPDVPADPDAGSGWQIRDDIAAALSTVTGISGYVKRPSAAKAGDAWPKLQGREHISLGSWETSWQIVVKLPVDDRVHDEWIIERFDPIVDALDDLVWIISVEVGESADSPALLINCKE